MYCHPLAIGPQDDLSANKIPSQRPPELFLTSLGSGVKSPMIGARPADKERQQILDFIPANLKWVQMKHTWCGFRRGTIRASPSPRRENLQELVGIFQVADRQLFRAPIPREPVLLQLFRGNIVDISDRLQLSLGQLKHTLCVESDVSSDCFLNMSRLISRVLRHNETIR